MSLFTLLAVLQAEPAKPPEPVAPPEIIRVEREGETVPTDLTGAVTILRAESWAGRITTLPELLNEAAGLRVRSWGGLGSFATVSVRGSSAEQVNVYLDGVRMNAALGGGVNLSDFPLDNVESIEIYRGFSPSFLQGAALGGAINIRTRRAAGARTEASLSYGSFGTGTLAARVPFGGVGAAGVLSVNGETSRGDFSFYDNNGTPITVADDGYERRENNTFWSGEATARMELPAGTQGHLDLSGSLARKASGVPGIDAFQSLTAESVLSRAMARVAYTREAAQSVGVRLDMDAFFSRAIYEFTDQSGDTTGGAAADTRAILEAAGPSMLIRWKPRSRAGNVNYAHFVSALLSGRHETADRLDRLNPASVQGEASRWLGEIGVEDEIHFAGGRVIVSPSARAEFISSRFDVNDDRRIEMTGRMGVAAHPGPHVTLRASAGRFHRPPSFTEIFGDAGSVRGSGGDLQPETGLAFDGGVIIEAGPEGTRDHVRLEASGFLTEADDLIQFILVSQSQVVAANTGRARIMGLELSAAADLSRWLDLGINYTWQVARDRSESFSSGSDLPGRPRHEVSAHASAGAAASRWGRLSWNFDYVGPNWFDRAAATLGTGSGLPRDLLRSPGRFLHGLGYTRRISDLFEITIQADNLLDVHTVDVARYPLPGRYVAGRVRVLLP